MPKRAKRAKVNDEPIILVDNPMKAKHGKPSISEHGLCLANPARVLVVSTDPDIGTWDAGYFRGVVDKASKPSAKGIQTLEVGGSGLAR